MKDFVFDVSWFENAPNAEIYYMYRGLAKDENDKQAMEKNNLRYDITTVPPRMLGMEFTKTIGHEHALVPNTNITYTEIYEVLKGEAIYLLQKSKDRKIIDIYAVKTKAGEKCIIPPNYGHVTINASNQELIMSNWVESHFKSDYELFKKNRGAGYYALKNENGLNWQKNKNYEEVPDIRIYDAIDFLPIFGKFGMNFSAPMYRLVNEIEKLDFLKYPQRYAWDK